MKCTVLLLFLPCLVSSMKEKVYMKRSEMEDQTSSETGYSYQLQSGTPFAYPYGYAPLQLANYGQELQPQLAPQGLPLNTYGVHAYPVAYGLNNIVQPVQEHQINIPAPVQAPPLLPIQPFQAPPVPVKVGESEASSFSKGGGSSYSAGDEASKGEKGEKAYKSQESQEKSLEGKHQKEGNKGHYNEESGKKSGHHDIGAQYGQQEAEAKGNHGASFSHAQKHKKGSKTKGFRHFHHKDEYKKDHEFWDEADTSGHFNKYDNANSQHSEQKGGFEKGGHQVGAFEAKEHAAKGFEDKGAHLDKDSAFKNEEGKQSHFKDFQEYGKKGGQQDSQIQGFSQAEGKLFKQI